MDKERQKLIGVRLRTFREALQIHRTKFALSIGLGSERMASYESGRAMLPYDVFYAIARRYHLSALWLAGDGGNSKRENEFNDSRFINEIKGRRLFTDVYDTYLAADLKAESELAEKAVKDGPDVILDLLSKLDDEKLPVEFRLTLARKLISPLTLFYGRLNDHRQLQRQANTKLNEVLTASEFNSANNELTNQVESLTTGHMQPVLPKLIERLNRATGVRGRKTELAAWLGVHRQSVTDWLSGKQEPGGEITLRLLTWVEQQERQK
jgi:transcriptional regulator with XRE-family HTH domain